MLGVCEWLLRCPAPVEAATTLLLSLFLNVLIYTKASGLASRSLEPPVEKDSQPVLRRSKPKRNVAFVDDCDVDVWEIVAHVQKISLDSLISLRAKYR